MNIENICTQPHIAELSIYGHENAISGAEHLLRQECISRGENVKEKDHLLFYAKYILERMAAGTDAYEIKKQCVGEFFGKESSEGWQVIGIFEDAAGLGAIKRRTQLVESLKGSSRGMCAFQIISQEGTKKYEALVSNGMGRVLSSLKCGFNWVEKPSLKQCIFSLLVGEYNIALELVKQEIDRQSNLMRIKEMGIEPGGVIDGYTDHGIKKKKIKILEISRKGFVTFEILAPGIKEKKRVKREVEARLLKVA